MIEVNLMGASAPSDDDVDNGMMAEIHRLYPTVEYFFLLQKMIGTLVGILPGMQDIAYTPSAAEAMEIKAFAAHAFRVQAEGRGVRADAALLRRVLAAEAGTAPLAEDDLDGQALLAARAARAAEATL